MGNEAEFPLEVLFMFEELLVLDVLSDVGMLVLELIVVLVVDI